MKLVRIAFALAAPLLLASCLLTPGRFVSTLDIKADRSFTFTYAGEVKSTDIDEIMRSTASGSAQAGGATPAAGPESAADIARQKALAATLAQEEGYRSVEYLGGKMFRVDYAISGRLDRSFLFPVNLDVHSLLPWVVIEVRKDKTARVKALAFGDPDELAPLPPGVARPERSETDVKGREGTFTLTTQAALVDHNSDAGGTPAPGTPLVWKITPKTSQVPNATVRFAN